MIKKKSKKPIASKLGAKKPEIKKIEMLHLFYMAPVEVTVKQLSELMEADQDLSIEVWDALEIMEIERSNKNYIDFEPMDINFDHPDDKAFLEAHSIKTIYAITLNVEDKESMMKHFESMVEQFGGLVCTDSDDFQPMIVAPKA